MNLGLLSIILLVAVCQGIPLSIALFSKKGKAYKWLSVFILLLTYFLFKAFITVSGLNPSFPYLKSTGFLVIPLIPPSFYLYLKYLIRKQVSRTETLYHFIFAAVQTIYWAPLFLASTDYRSAIGNGQVDSLFYSNSMAVIFEVLHILQHLFYIFLVWRFVLSPSFVTDLNKSWIWKITVFFTLYASTYAIGTFLYWFTSWGMGDVVYYTTIAVFIYLIGYYGISNSDLLGNLMSLTKPKYSYVDMSKDESEKLYMHINSIILSDMLYLEDSLKISDLSKYLGVSVNKISRAINENYEQSFSNYVNRFRVEQAKKLLMDQGNDDKLFAIALNSGYKNKVSFFKNFKKIEGISPSEFREMHSKKHKVNS